MLFGNFWIPLQRGRECSKHSPALGPLYKHGQIACDRYRSRILRHVVLLWVGQQAGADYLECSSQDFWMLLSVLISDNFDRWSKAFQTSTVYFALGLQQGPRSKLQLV